MIKLTNYLTENDFVGDPQSSCLTVSLNDFFKRNIDVKLKDFQFINLLIKYPKRWLKDSDIFQYIDKNKIDQLRNDKKVILFFDATTEGYSPFFEAPFFDVLYFNCTKYNIDPRKIYFVSSNLLDNENILKYNKKNNVTTSINVFTFPAFELATKDIVWLYDATVGSSYKLNQLEFESNYNGEKYFSSLSRVNRPYRSLAQFHLCQSNVSNKAIISHNSINENHNHLSEMWKQQYKSLENYSSNTIKQWLDNLPLIADTKDFDTNHALKRNNHIYNTTLFHVANETQADSLANTSLFYSEKTFKPIAHFQPFLIYGQVNCNKKLSDIGYQLYEDWFDYDFDSEPDIEYRYIKLLKEIERVVTYLKGLNLQEQKQWRFKNIEVLKNNFKVLITNEYTKKIINDIGTAICENSDIQTDKKSFYIWL